MSVTVQDTRSQAQNRELARERLLKALNERIRQHEAQAKFERERERRQKRKRPHRVKVKILENKKRRGALKRNRSQKDFKLMNSKKWDVVVLGGINTDYIISANHLPSAGQTVQGKFFCIHAGGKGANQAVAAARLGAKVALIGRVGDEPRGCDLLRRLRKEKINLDHVTRDQRTSTGAAIIAVDSTGEKQITAALGANHTMPLKQIRDSARIIAEARVLLMQFEAPLPCVMLAAKIAKKHGTRVILDPAPPTQFPSALYKFLDVIRPNSDEAEKLTGIKVR